MQVVISRKKNCLSHHREAAHDQVCLLLEQAEVLNYAQALVHNVDTMVGSNYSLRRSMWRLALVRFRTKWLRCAYCCRSFTVLAAESARTAINLVVVAIIPSDINNALSIGQLETVLTIETEIVFLILALTLIL